MQKICKLNFLADTIKWLKHENEKKYVEVNLIVCSGYVKTDFSGSVLHDVTVSRGSLS